MALSDMVALSSAAAGLIAAFHWYKASKIRVQPVWDDHPELAPNSMKMYLFGWVNALGAAFFWSSNKNAVAALWTALSVFLSAISVIMSKWP
jgi:hypothetical protein